MSEPRVVEARKQAIVAEFLVRSNLEFCHRATLRALFPAGVTRTYKNARARADADHGTSRNLVTRGFQKALKELEKRGLITRGSEFVRVEDRAGLAAFLKTRHLSAEWLAHIERAAESIEAEIEREDRPMVIERRRQELLAIQRLMVDARGERWSGRGSVAFVPRGKAL